MNSGRMQDSSHETIDAQNGGNVNRTEVHLSDRTLSILAFALAIAALATSMWMTYENDHMYRHVEELRIRLQDQQVALQLAGVLKIGDADSGPGANTKRLKEH